MATASIPAQAAPLAGRWGGEQTQLAIDEHGARLEMDCASGTMVGPLRPGSDGRFVAEGTFTQHQGGPQRADEGGQAPKARYSGEVRAGVMTLSILPEGASKPQVFTLREGVSVKLPRCL
jgi:hypothetical protein